MNLLEGSYPKLPRALIIHTEKQMERYFANLCSRGALSHSISLISDLEESKVYFFLIPKSQHLQDGPSK